MNEEIQNLLFQKPTPQAPTTSRAVLTSRKAREKTFDNIGKLNNVLGLLANYKTNNYK